MIALEEVDKLYGERRALAGVNLRVEPGEIVAVIGPSGAGKSTLLRSFIGLETISRGRVVCFDKTLGPTGNDEDTLRAVRATVGFCFQDFQLFPHKTALDNVALPLTLRRDALPLARARERAREVLARVDCLSFAERYPGSLSGGQKQRVALARALVLEPRAVLFDEPVSALDPECVADVVQECRDLGQKGIAVIATTHHLPFARAIATRVVFMVDGQVVESGSPAELFATPQSDRLKEYLAHCLA